MARKPKEPPIQFTLDIDAKVLPRLYELAAADLLEHLADDTQFIDDKLRPTLKELKDDQRLQYLVRQSLKRFLEGNAADMDYPFDDVDVRKEFKELWEKFTTLNDEAERALRQQQLAAAEAAKRLPPLKLEVVLPGATGPHQLEHIIRGLRANGGKVKKVEQ